MGQKVLIDTNICIGYFGATFDLKIMDQLDKLVSGEYHLSVINQIELLGFKDLSLEEENIFSVLLGNSILHGLDEKIIDATIGLRKKHHIKIPDAIIAATCIIHKLAILTKNTKDFEKIEKLEVIPFENLENYLF